ncbi:MAG: hypothetical protein WEB59_11595 [Thermoanaerobaculia bacterium]
MKRPSVFALVPAALALAAAPLFAANGPAQGRGPRVVTRSPASAAKSARIDPAPATAATYSVQVNIVTRVQGTSFFRTAIDITNNTTTDNVTATFQYCYNLNNVYQCTPGETLTLLSFQSFHEDDFVQYLGTLGVLAPGAEESSFGTLLVTFDGLPSGNGWEGTVTARTYNPYIVNGATVGTLAIAYPGSLFFESATGSLVGLIRDTQPAPTVAGALRTNLGITNTDVDGVGPVSVQLSFYDVTENSPTNGQEVGTRINMANLEAGEVRQINNIFDETQANIPSNVTSCIVFADITAGDIAGTIEGYINILDGGTQDGAFFELKCSVGCPSF